MIPTLTHEEREEHEILTDDELDGWLASDRKVIGTSAFQDDHDVVRAEMSMRLYATIEADREHIAELEAKLKKRASRAKARPELQDD